MPTNKQTNEKLKKMEKWKLINVGKGKGKIGKEKANKSKFPSRLSFGPRDTEERKRKGAKMGSLHRTKKPIASLRQGLERKSK